MKNICLFLVCAGISGFPFSARQVPAALTRVNVAGAVVKKKWIRNAGRHTQQRVFFYPQLKTYVPCDTPDATPKPLPQGYRVQDSPRCFCSQGLGGGLQVSMVIDERQLHSLFSAPAGSRIYGANSIIYVEQRGNLLISIPVTAAQTDVSYMMAYVREARERTLAPLQNVQFENNSAILRVNSYAALDATASRLQAGTETVAVNGYASAEGTAAHAMALSKDRANAVKTYLVNAGVDARRLKVKGYGETHPIADVSTEEGRVSNRRVEFKLQ